MQKNTSRFPAEGGNILERKSRRPIRKRMRRKPLHTSDHERVKKNVERQ